MPNIRINESQLLLLAAKARIDNAISGYLHKRSADTAKWQQRWFALYQNILFYYENDQTTRPSGVALLEGCYCERIITPSSIKGEKQYCFAIYYKKEGQRQYDLRTDTDTECSAWIDAIRNASYSRLVEHKEQLEQKHLHLLQILDSERQSKWHYVQQTEELHQEVKKLKAELKEYKSAGVPTNSIDEEESDEIKKIKKVQSFFRGWLCRRRWKQIVDEYIRSPHAESMRKRNSIVFGMVEGEEEYVKNLSAMVSCFLRPLRMAASSKKPPITHEDVNSIFLNSETLLFLHQIFLKGLTARMDNWPTLVLGDLFDMLLPMLGIYQEYVRNHHYSLQVLAEYKQKPEFNALLKRYEEKPITESRVLETFLTYPMHQIPRYIVTLHDLLAHTPHDHVERKSLEFAMSKLEELSRIMHDEVSETENIRKNLAIERMIVEGCDILLDVNQTFVRQGTLLQVYNEKPKPSRGRLGSFSSSFKETKKEIVRQVFLFTNHCLLTSRASNGRLHLAKHYGKIPLIDCTLVEDSSSDLLSFEDETSSSSSLESGLCNLTQTGTSLTVITTQSCDKVVESKVDSYNSLDFRIIVDSKSGPPVTITLVASTAQEKAAWCSDISQCVENLHYSDLLNTSMSDTSSVTMPQSVRSDPRLFRDDYDIKYSRTLNSCKVPQIRHASVDRLLGRLTDLRFLSIDFLNTFLLTYRVFTNGVTVLEALKRVARNPECGNIDGSNSQLCDADVFQSNSSVNIIYEDSPPVNNKLRQPKHEKLRRISTGSMRIEVTGMLTESSQDSDSRGDADDDSSDDNVMVSPTSSEVAGLLFPPKRKLAPIASCETLSESSGVIPSTPTSINSIDRLSVTPTNADVSGDLLLECPGITINDATTEESSSDNGVKQSDSSQSFGSSSNTLVDSSPADTSPDPQSTSNSPAPASPTKTVDSPRRPHPHLMRSQPVTPVVIVRPDSSDEADTDDNVSSSTKQTRRVSSPTRTSSPLNIPATTQQRRASSPVKSTSPTNTCQTKRSSSPIIYSFSSPNVISGLKSKQNKRDSHGDSSASMTPRGSLAVDDSSPKKANPGTVVTSSRASKRSRAFSTDTYSLRSSSSAATMAFAAATAGMATPHGHPKVINRYHSAGAGDLKPYLVNRKKESVISTAATMRVLNVLRHWVSKHSQDFETDPGLKAKVRDMLEEMVCNSALLPAEHKAAASILRTMAKDEADHCKIDLTGLLEPPMTSSKDTFDSLSALDIAEQLTYLDHQIFMNIRSEELLCQAWMKPEKARKAPHVLLVSKRFNEVSRLVVSEIIRRDSMLDRVAAIEKWAAIADICRCMHNYNGVLQICAAFVNSSVYRLKKTWDRLSKQTKQMIEKLQTLVASDGRFKNMRDALHRCDPPCIPYLGMYLTDLSFIEESTPNITDESLVNYSKMRMIAHVIREVQQFQQTPYKIEHHQRVTNYLLDESKLLDEDETYKASLCIEPRQSRVSMTPSL